MEKNEDNIEKTSDFKQFRRNLIVIGIITTGASVYGYFQLSFFYTYIKSVLGLSTLHIALMVTLSSIAALVSLLFFGIISDNTRTKVGRRRPYLLFGIVAGLGMFLFGFIQDYALGLFIKVVLVEVAISAYYSVQRSLIADLIPVEHRGKANGINGIISMVGMILAVAATLIAQENFVVGGDLNQEGHIFLFTLSLIIIIICSIGGFIFLKEPPISELPPKMSFMTELKEMFQFGVLVKKHNEYFKMLVAQGIFFIGLMMIAPYIFIYIFELELSTADMTTIVLILTPVILIVILVLGKLTDKYGRKKVIPPTILISSIGFIMIPFVAVKGAVILPLATIAIILSLLGFVGVLVPVSAWQQDLYPEEKRGQFVGILNAMNMITAIPGALVGGLIYATLGIEWIFAFVPIFLIGSIPFFLKVEETLPDELRK